MAWQKHKNIYLTFHRTTLEVESVGDGGYAVRKASAGGRGLAERAREARTRLEEKEKPARRHVSVTTMRIGGTGEEV